jgi:hypothetical protein
VERDPNGVPEPPLVQRDARRVRVDKSACRRPSCWATRSSLALGGDCPSCPQADILLAIDRSGSMNEGQKITDTRKAAAAFIDAIDLERDRVGIVAFSNGGEVVQPLTNDRAAAKAAIAGLQALGGTNITIALDVAVGELFGPRGRPDTQPVIILLTTGGPRAGERPRAGQALRPRPGCSPSASADVDPMVMVLSATTPEEFFYAPDSATLGEIYTTIARRITASVLARSMTVTDDLPADMRYVTSVAGPAPVVTGQRLTWQLTDVPFTGYGWPTRCGRPRRAAGRRTCRPRPSSPTAWTGPVGRVSRCPS